MLHFKCAWVCLDLPLVLVSSLVPASLRLDDLCVRVALTCVCIYIVLGLGPYACYTSVLPLNCVCCPVLINFLYNFLIASIVVLLSVSVPMFPVTRRKTKTLLVDNRSLYYCLGPTVREHNFIGYFLEPGREKWEWYSLNIVYAH